MSKCTLGQASASISASRNIPAPKCGMIDRHARVGERHALQVERVAVAHLERAGQAELLARAHRQHPAVDEHGRARRGGGQVEDPAPRRASSADSGASPGTGRCRAGRGPWPRRCGRARRRRVGSSMKNPTKRSGWAATAPATEASSPGSDAISAARETPWASSSETHRGGQGRDRDVRFPLERLGHGADPALRGPALLRAQRVEESRREEVDVRVGNHRGLPVSR